jgi:linoleoyl-CoA desaturase
MLEKIEVSAMTRNLEEPLVRRECDNYEHEVSTASLSKGQDIGLGTDGCCLGEFSLPQSYKKHPGGQHVLDMARRSDVAGLLFLSYHMGSDLSGKVEKAARALGITMPKRGSMYNEMHQAIRQARLAYPQQRLCFLAWCMILTIVLPLVALWWVLQPSILSSMMTAVMFEFFFLNIFHTRHHQGGRLYQNETLHRWTLPFYEFLDATWGYYPNAWVLNHHVKHHVFTNDHDVDTDVPAIYPYVRACYDQQRFWYHGFQTFYWPLLVPFTSIQFPVNNVLTHGGRYFHFCSFVIVMFVLPLMLHGWTGLRHTLLVQGVAGSSLAYKFAVSHAHDATTSTSSSQESYADIDLWLAAQIEDSISYGGYITTFLFGGINMQIEHHLCPSLEPPLYHIIAPEIARISAKYGVRYTREPSFFHAVWQFHKKLWLMGKAS